MIQKANDIPVNESFFERDVSEIDPKALARVRHIIEATNAKIVISSSWRLLHPVFQLVKILQAAGWEDINEHIIGATPIIRETNFRGDEVLSWLSRRQPDEIESFVCLDDDSDFHPDQFLIQTNWKNGIQDEHVTRAIQVLGAKTETVS